MDAPVASDGVSMPPTAPARMNSAVSTGAARRGGLQRARASLRVPDGSFFDAFPLSVLTSSSLEQLGEFEPQGRFDARRFRMNVLVDTTEPGFVENEWLGRKLAIGGEVRIAVAMPDPAA